jgi:ABC-type glycerol-3-phosphate transport system substrate-binding protein
MKRTVLIITIALAAAGLVFGNGSAAQGGAAKPAVPPKIIWYAPTGANSDKAFLEGIQKIIMDETGVDLDYVAQPTGAAEVTNKLNLMLAGGEQLDIWQTTSWETYQKIGALSELTAETNKYPDLLELHGNAFGRMKSSDGKIWGIPRNGDASHFPLWVRQDWLDKYGLEVPSTVEEYENVLKVFKERDPMGNGQTIPLLTNYAGFYEHWGNTFLGGWLENGSGVYIAPDGKVYPPFMDPGYKDVLAKFNDWYRKGYMDKETFVFTSNQMTDMIKQGRVGSGGIRYTNFTSNEDDMQDLYPEAKWTQTHLKGPKGYIQTINAYARYLFGNAGGGSAYVVNSNCKNLAAAVKVLAWGFAKPENFLTVRYGPEGLAWKWVDKSASTFDLLTPKRMISNEYCMALGIVTEGRVNRPNETRHEQYLSRGELFDFRFGKYPLDGGINFDNSLINAQVSNFEDLVRILDEETVKFMTGARPLSQYNDFIEAFKRAGIDKLSEELTRQYNAGMAKK